MRQFNLLSLLILASVAMWSSPDEAAAQRVRYGISFGNGGVRIGVGNGPIYGPGYGGYAYGPRFGYGPGYGYGYGPPPVVVRPYPIYQPQPVYVQPQYIQQPAVVGESYGSGGPSPIADGGEILLFSPASNPGDVRYTLNGNPYTMPPGTKQKFRNDRTWTIEFESSPGRVMQYTLTSSRYKFKPSDAGLGLYQTQDLPEATLQGVPAAPIPDPPVPSTEGSVVPPRPPLKTAP